MELDSMKERIIKALILFVEATAYLIQALIACIGLYCLGFFK